MKKYRKKWNKKYLMKMKEFICLSDKEPTCQFRRFKRCVMNPWAGKIPWRGHGSLLQHSCLENPVDRGTWQGIVPEVSKSQTWLKQLSTHTEVSTFYFLIDHIFWFELVPEMSFPLRCSFIILTFLTLKNT